MIDAPGRLYHPKALRASMGAVFHAPVFPSERAPAVAFVAATGRPVAVLTPEGAAPLDVAPLDDGIVLVIGNERRGVNPAWRRIGTVDLTIPMVGFVDSLNAATSASIVLWEVLRRRTR